MGCSCMHLMSSDGPTRPLLPSGAPIIAMAQVLGRGVEVQGLEGIGRGGSPAGGGKTAKPVHTANMSYLNACFPYAIV